MAKFNDLVKTDPKLAAGILQDALVHIVNTFIPNIYITKEELKILLPIICSGEAKDPSESNGKPTGGETTTEPSTPDTGEESTDTPEQGEV